MLDIRKAVAKLIETTEDPTAPIKLNQLYGAADKVGRMLAVKASKDKVDTIKGLMLKQWNEDNIDDVAYSPEFIIALCAMLCQSLVGYTNKLTGDE